MQLAHGNSDLFNTLLLEYLHNFQKYEFYDVTDLDVPYNYAVSIDFYLMFIVRNNKKRYALPLDALRDGGYLDLSSDGGLAMLPENSTH